MVFVNIFKCFVTKKNSEIDKNLKDMMLKAYFISCLSFD